jgi:hypothetical protein
LFYIAPLNEQTHKKVYESLLILFDRSNTITRAGFLCEKMTRTLYAIVNGYIEEKKNTLGINTPENN